MISLVAKTREKGNVNVLKNAGQVPAVVYGPETKNVSVQVDEKEFKKVLREAGESTLVELLVEKDPSSAKASEGAVKKPVLIHEIQKDPVTDKIIHIDFFQPSLKQEVQVAIPLTFEGVAPAEKDLGGTLNKNILEIEVKALPQNLPHEIKVNVETLKTFEDHILVRDLVIPANVEVLKQPDEIVASVLAPRDVEAELAEEIKEEVSEVEKVEKEKKEEEVVEDASAQAGPKEAKPETKKE